MHGRHPFCAAARRIVEAKLFSLGLNPFVDKARLFHASLSALYSRSDSTLGSVDPFDAFRDRDGLLVDSLVRIRNPPVHVVDPSVERVDRGPHVRQVGRLRVEPCVGRLDPLVQIPVPKVCPPRCEGSEGREKQGGQRHRIHAEGYVEN